MEITTAPTLPQKADVIIRLTGEEAVHLRRFFGDLLMKEIADSMSHYDSTSAEQVYDLTQAIFSELADRDY